MSAGNCWDFSTNRGLDPGTAWQDRRGRSRERSLIVRSVDFGEATRGGTDVTELAGAIVESLRSVHDPCCRDRGLSVVDMGLIRSIDTDPTNRWARVELILTTGWCPFAANVLETVQEAALAVDGVDDAEVEIVWDEPWTMDRLSPAARAQLVFLPNPAEVADRDQYVSVSLKGAVDDR
jgi:metal-sulfur cluster biosynthetic enzyme